MCIFIVDDHPLVRQALAMNLRRHRVVAPIVELDRFSEIGKAIREHGEPELVCLDLRLPDTNGVSGVREFRTQWPETPLAVLSALPASDYEALALESGANCYIEKTQGASKICQIIFRMLAPSVSPDSTQAQLPRKLSTRQTELLQLINKGYSNRDIAAALGLSEHTVKVHLWRLFRSIQVKNRSQACYYARESGIIG